MPTHATASTAAGLIDRLRDLIAKVSGSPGRGPQGAKPIAARAVPAMALIVDTRAAQDRDHGDAAV